MLSGLDLGGFSEEGAGWPVCAGQAHTLLMDSSLPASLASAKSALASLPFRGIPVAPPAQVSGDVTAGKKAAHCIPPSRKTKH